jgi:acetyl esterase/lipase
MGRHPTVPVLEAGHQASGDASVAHQADSRASLAGSPAFDSGVVYKNITYPTQAGPAQQLDVYTPREPAPAGGWPVIVAIHGGGWRRYSKQEYGPRIASAFVPAGYVVVAPNYLLSRPGRPSWPVNLGDVRSAVVWVKANAAAYGIDPNRVVAMGESAGANLANLLGTESGTNRPAAVQAVVSFSSPTDLTSLLSESPQAGRAAAQLLGGLPTSLPQLYAAASPVDQAGPGSAPTLLIHGGDDPLVPVSQSIELAGALTAAGVPNRLIILPGAGHDLNYPINTPSDLTTQILEFLAATWNDKGSHNP